MKLSEIILRDTRANQPAAAAVGAGTIYYVTDEAVTERSSGVAWEDISDGVVPTLTVLTADPVSPADDTAWVVREAGSPLAVSLRARIAGVTYTIAAISI